MTIEQIKDLAPTPVAKIVSYDTKPIERPLAFTLEEAFEFFNQRLWDGALEPVVLLLDRPRSESIGGHYSPGRWRSRDGIAANGTREQLLERDEELWVANSKVHGAALGNPNGWERGEIALNPEAWPRFTDRYILSILVHEMAHHWQATKSPKKARLGYHDRIWGKEMKRVGLHPSNTGEEGGRETGQQMAHYIVEGGMFDVACEELLAEGMRLEWEAPKPRRAKKPKSKLKYTCECGQNAWAKPNAKLSCGLCNGVMMVEDEEKDDE